ncbi:uncharacterized protein [Rutidosis leptorrhynchoides]|uniref:uncharacterized protein n=1 Tax=Rutidosis leptorrhynchoides TaxID=125765 RepID=UPI003A991840
MGKKYKWTEQNESAFQMLKQKLTTAPILSLPEGNEDFVKYCDASREGFGCVLMQRNKKQLNMRQRRWVELLNDYDCEIRYHPGKENIVTNALSRKDRVKPLRVRALNMTVRMNLTSQIRDAQLDAMKPENIVTESIKGKTYKMEKLAQTYLKEVISRHGVLVSIFSNHDSRFTSTFWQTLQQAMGTRLDLSITYHQQINGQSERTIQTLEEMLRACEIDFGNGWDHHLPLAEFLYNNRYHTSIKDAPFEALFGRKCRYPLC